VAYLSKKEAQEAGKAGLDLLHDPEGWDIRISQNLGWHVSLFKQGMTLTRCPVTDEFTVLCSSTGEEAGELFWYVSGSFTDPNEAICAQLQAVDGFIQRILTVRKAHSSAFMDGIGVHTGMVRLFGIKAPQSKFCEVTGIPQSTVSTWKILGKVSFVVRFLFSALLFIKAIGSWELFLQTMKELEGTQWKD